MIPVYLPGDKVFVTERGVEIAVAPESVSCSSGAPVDGLAPGLLVSFELLTDPDAEELASVVPRIAASGVVLDC